MHTTLSEELQWRGFVNQTTLTNNADLDTGQLTFYFGVDPSSDSMTVGNLAMAMMVRHFIDHGHKAILLVGGATGMIGDPDGKAEERELKSLDEIAKNKAGIAQQYKRIFADQAFEIVDNYDWFKTIGYLQFLRDIGKHFSMSQLLDREFVKSRIGAGGRGISYAEFSYSLIQGYDFLHLFREKGVSLQLAGADQWGNAIAGVELIRKLEAKEAHVWTGPLVMNTATGKKFGKSEEGAVWLDEAKTSVYKFYQFWLNVDDAGVGHYLRIYTLLPREAIERLEDAAKTRSHERAAQKALAFEVTKLVHGEDRAQSVRRVSEVLFGARDFTELDAQDIDELATEIPEQKPGQLFDVLLAAGLVGSKGEARRLLDSGGISVNGAKATEDAAITAPALIKKGKNSFCLVR
jgi:tyrosyl-tRNA synthetase